MKVVLNFNIPQRPQFPFTEAYAIIVAGIKANRYELIEYKENSRRIEITLKDRTLEKEEPK